MPELFAISGDPDQTLRLLFANYRLMCLQTKTLLLLNTTCPVLANSVDPDQLASEEAN